MMRDGEKINLYLLIPCRTHTGRKSRLRQLRQKRLNIAQLPARCSFTPILLFVTLLDDRTAGEFSPWSPSRAAKMDASEIACHRWSQAHSQPLLTTQQATKRKHKRARQAHTSSEEGACRRSASGANSSALLRFRSPTFKINKCRDAPGQEGACHRSA